MTLDRYDYFVNKAKNDFPDMIKETQSKLDLSKSKGEDLYLLNWFWGLFMSKVAEKWNNSSILLCDDESMMPMPESVSKQFLNMLFKIKNINLLYDLGIYDGLYDYEYYAGHPECVIDDEPTSKEEIIHCYNENFAEN